VSASTHAPCVGDASGTVADSTTSKYLFASPQAPQVRAEQKVREGCEGVGEDQSDSTNVDDVLISTHAPVNFDLDTPEFSQVRDPAPSESPNTNKDDAEEDEGNN
jgi:hypothetical protein